LTYGTSQAATQTAEQAADCTRSATLSRSRTGKHCRRNGGRDQSRIAMHDAKLSIALSVDETRETVRFIPHED
jgi:hypothetical protein